LVQAAYCLYEAGAEVNEPNDDGQTPLFMACAEGHVAMLPNLVMLGADANWTDKWGNTPLHVICMKTPDRVRNWKN
jgi:ankyrin repeat protein